MHQVDAKDLVSVISNKDFGKLLEKMFNVGPSFVGREAIVSAGWSVSRL